MFDLLGVNPFTAESNCAVKSEIMAWWQDEKLFCNV